MKKIALSLSLCFTFLLCSCVSQLKINSAKGETRHWIVPELNTEAVSYNGTARPAFTIDATYDMSQDNVIRFKGAVLEIVSYNNQNIKYKVISGFKK
ncbi:MAG: hypothetical protein II103_03075 [Treponema sp.]|nr:hypothetical protein [Treponema sp.]MBQ2355518.1 hypothetical protein [Treponema sp.]